MRFESNRPKIARRAAYCPEGYSLFRSFCRQFRFYRPIRALAGPPATGLSDEQYISAGWKGTAKACELPDGYVWAAAEDLAEVYPVPNAFGAYVKAK